MRLANWLELCSWEVGACGVRDWYRPKSGEMQGQKGAAVRFAISFETRYVQPDPVVGEDGKRMVGLRGQRTNASQCETVSPSKGFHECRSDRGWARAVWWCKRAATMGCCGRWMGRG